jgi:hypothetical protein
MEATNVQRVKFDKKKIYSSKETGMKLILKKSLSSLN